MYFYVDREDGFLQRLHPNTKLLGVVGIFVAAMLVMSPYFTGPIALAVALLIIMAGGWKSLLKISPFILLLMVATLVTWSLFIRSTGPLLFKLGPIKISAASLSFGIGMGFRVAAMIFAGLFFLTTTRVEDFTAGLNRAGVPFGVCFALSLSFRLLPTFIDSALTIADAQRARGLDLETGGIIKRLKKYVPLIIPVFLTSLRSADNLAMALEAKGFGAIEKRTYIKDYAIGLKDIIFIAGMAAAIAAIVMLRN